MSDLTVYRREKDDAGDEKFSKQVVSYVELEGDELDLVETAYECGDIDEVDNDAGFDLFTLAD